MVLKEERVDTAVCDRKSLLWWWWFGLVYLLFFPLILEEMPHELQFSLYML